MELTKPFSHHRNLTIEEPFIQKARIKEIPSRCLVSLWVLSFGSVLGQVLIFVMDAKTQDVTFQRQNLSCSLESLHIDDNHGTSSYIDTPTPPNSPLLDDQTVKDLMQDESIPYDIFPSLAPTTTIPTRAENTTIVTEDKNTVHSKHADIDNISTTSTIGHIKHKHNYDEPSCSSLLSPTSDDGALVTLLGPSLSPSEALKTIDADSVQEVLKDFGEEENSTASSMLLDDNDIHVYLNNCNHRIDSSVDPKHGGENDETDEELRNCLNETLRNCIKKELNLKIRYSRFKSGLEEPSLEMEPPRMTISYEAIQKRNEARVRNRYYARRSREKATVRKQELNKEYEELTQHSQRLEKALDVLKSKRNILQQSLDEHYNAGICSLTTADATVAI